MGNQKDLMDINPIATDVSPALYLLNSNYDAYI